MSEDSMPSSLRVLLRGAVDYAGLFPPAALPMGEAIANYAGYRGGADAWALGRFVVPASRLPELADGLLRVKPGVRGREPWPLSVTLAADWTSDLASIQALGDRKDRLATVDAIEAKVAGAAGPGRLRDALAGAVPVFGEVPLGPDQGAVLQALSRHGFGAKIRLGGISAAAFPPADPVVAFLVETARLGLAFKATAGLHHPFRGVYRLTYAPGGPSGPMYGYLPFLVAAVLAGEGADQNLVRDALLEDQAGAIRPEADRLLWRERDLAPPALARLRERFQGIGSCSFREPIDELRPVLAA